LRRKEGRFTEHDISGDMARKKEIRERSACSAASATMSAWADATI
jgi:hypothetical protein